jgi:hypothetical protein
VAKISIRASSARACLAPRRRELLPCVAAGQELGSVPPIELEPTTLRFDLDPVYQRRQLMEQCVDQEVWCWHALVAVARFSTFSMNKRCLVDRINRASASVCPQHCAPPSRMPGRRTSWLASSRLSAGGGSTATNPAEGHGRPPPIRGARLRRSPKHWLNAMACCWRPAKQRPEGGHTLHRQRVNRTGAAPYGTNGRESDVGGRRLGS